MRGRRAKVRLSRVLAASGASRSPRRNKHRAPCKALSTTAAPRSDARKRARARAARQRLAARRGKPAARRPGLPRSCTPAACSAGAAASRSNGSTCQSWSCQSWRQTRCPTTRRRRRRRCRWSPPPPQPPPPPRATGRGGGGGSAGGVGRGVARARWAVRKRGTSLTLARMLEHALGLNLNPLRIRRWNALP